MVKISGIKKQKYLRNLKRRLRERTVIKLEIKRLEEEIVVIDKVVLPAIGILDLESVFTQGYRYNVTTNDTGIWDTNGLGSFLVKKIGKEATRNVIVKSNTYTVNEILLRKLVKEKY